MMKQGVVRGMDRDGGKAGSPLVLQNEKHTVAQSILYVESPPCRQRANFLGLEFGLAMYICTMLAPERLGCLDYDYPL